MRSNNLRKKFWMANKRVVRQSWTIFASILGLTATILAFLDIDIKLRVTVLVILIVIFPASYLGILIWTYFKRSITLNVGDSEISVEQGNIFAPKYWDDVGSIKVFAFNEYFDTIVDDKIISHRSLNGQVIERLIPKTMTLENLDEKIASDHGLSANKVSLNSNRENGKQQRYKLGAIFEFSESVFFTALTHFDEGNRAFLSIQDYIGFLMKFWDEIDSKYAGRTVVITLFGSGITRLEQNAFSNQQLLEILLWTCKLRKIRFKKPAKFVILLDSKTNETINYYKVRSNFYGI